MKPIEFVASELKDDLLDYFVAVAMGWKLVMWGSRAVWVQADGEGRFRCNVADWHPSTNPAQAWPIIESKVIGVWSSCGGSLWHARGGLAYQEVFDGPTSLIAALRCFVASKLGEKFISLL